MRSPGLLCSLLIPLLSGAAFAQTPGCQEVTPRGNPGDQLGCSVTTDGATSAFGANMGNEGSGSVTVSGDSQPVVATDGAPGDQFGFATAIFRNTLIVGAPTADVQGRQDAGAVYVFGRNAGPWVQQAKITAPDAAAGAQFGFSLAFDGEVLAVGAPRDSSRGSFSGAVYLFEQTQNGEWVQIAKLTAGRARPFDEFGYAVAVSGITLIAGAPFEDGRAGGNQGAVHLFERGNGGWTEIAALEVSSAAAGDELGVAISLEGNGLAVGARRADVGGAVDAGAVYVFESVGWTWRERARLTAPGGGARDRFGGAVALDGGRLAVGAPQADNGAGLAYLFENEDGAWRFRETLRPAAGGSFGFSIALSGDTVVIGAFMARGGAGSAVACAISPPGVDLDLTLELPRSTRPGEQINQGLIVRNNGLAAKNGPATAVGVVLEESIPAGLQLVEISPLGVCTVQPGQPGQPEKISCRLGNIDPDTPNKPPTRIGIKWTVLSSCADRIETVATVRADNALPEESEPSSTALLLTADLAVTSSAPASARRGESISFDLTVTNNGPHCARGVVLTAPLPDGLVFLAQPSLAQSSACGLSGRKIRCSLGDLLPLDKRNLTLSFEVAQEAAAGAIDNTATVNARGTDPFSENSSSTASTTVLVGDLAITKSAGVESVGPEDLLLYTIMVTNLGNFTAEATVTDVFPVGLTAVLWCRDADFFSCTPENAGNIADTVSLHAGVTAIYRVRGIVAAMATGPLVNTASVTGPPGFVDVDPSNNSSTVRTAIGFSGVKAFCKEISGANVEEQTITYTFVLRNGGPKVQIDNPGNEFTDTLPATLTLVSASASSGVASTLGNTATWNGSIPVGGMVTITVTATINEETAGKAICNQTSLAFDADGNGTNESIGLSGGCCFQVLPTSAIPALSELGLLALAVLLAALALLRLRRRPAL